MYRKIFTVLGILAALILTASCGSTESSASSEPATYAGTWKMVDPTDSFDMTALVEEDYIEIYWISDDSESLYWKGTFPAQETASSEPVTSKANTEALAVSLLGSQDKTKTFEYSDGVLSFKMTVMGTTKTIELEKIDG